MADTIKTENELLDAFKDAQPAGSIKAQDVRDFVVSASHLHFMGWQFFLDGIVTDTGSPEPFTITGGDRHLITIDGGTEISGYPIVPTGANSALAFWSVTENMIKPSGLNDFGFVRLAITCESDSATNSFDLELDVSGLPNGTGSPDINGDLIYKQTEELIKGAGLHQHFNFVIPLFSGPTFQANGGMFYITPVNDMRIWTKGITAARLLKAIP